jgi:hypothetical protein
MKRTSSAMARSVGDELVILDPTTGKYFGLNDVGALIWDLLSEDHDRDELVEAVLSGYDVEISVAKTDVDELVEQLRDANLIDL